MLTIWGRRSSFNLQKVMWLVGELQVEHRHIELGGQFGGLDTPEFLAMNPHGRIPVIDDQGTVVWESHAILRYLAARFGGKSFWSDDPARALVRGSMDGLVGDDLAARLLERDLLGLLPNARSAAGLARDQAQP